LSEANTALVEYVADSCKYLMILLSPEAFFTCAKAFEYVNQSKKCSKYFIIKVK